MKNTLPIIIALAVLAGCKKEEVTELPAATTSGSNTFGAKVNGSFWVPREFSIAPSAALVEGSYSVNKTAITINARNYSEQPKESEFKIFLRNVYAPGTYLLDGRTGNYGYYLERKVTPLGAWKSNATHTGKVEVTRADTANNIFSGTFQFQAASEDGDAPINVTDGRFDVKIQL